MRPNWEFLLAVIEYLALISDNPPAVWTPQRKKSKKNRLKFSYSNFIPDRSQVYRVK